MSNPVVIHSKLSFSGRERWRACPASVALSEGMPDKSSPAAAEGTIAHTVAEWYVRQVGEAYGLPPATPAMLAEAPFQDPVMELDRFKKFEPELKPNRVHRPFIEEVEKWNEELRTHGKAYRAFILSLIPAGEQAFISLEQKVRAKSLSEHLFGTADCLIWLPRLRKLIVVDYKFGFVEVEIGDELNANAQLAAYAVAALDQCTLDAAGGVALAVFQPRRTFGRPAQVLELPWTWVDAERAKLAAEVAAVERGGAPNPGPHCRYCKGKSKCPTTHNALAAGIQAHGGLLDLLSIPKDALIDLWAARTAFKAFWEDVEELVEKEAKAGNPRLTVKETKGRQMWADQNMATLTLLALGRTDLLKPGNVSDCAPHMPDEWKAQLICSSAPSRSIKLVDDVSPSQIAQTFAKYVKAVDKP